MLASGGACSAGPEPLARIVASGAAGVDPALHGHRPRARNAQALERAGLTIDDIDLVELNEAFAAQVLASMRELGIDHDKLNVNGGAIAIGHPLGCSGARLIGTLACGAAPPRRALRGGHDVHRRRPGPRHGDREPRGLDSPPDMIDFELTDEQRLIRETARDFTDKEIAPRARENDRNEHFDTELVQKIADMGFLGAIVPEEYGGRGVDYRTYALIVEEIGRGCSAMRTVVSVVTSLVCSSIVRWGTEEQKQEWLPQLCSGEALGCFGLTEPDTGSDASNLKTRAEKIDGGWRINGGKMWISLGNYAKLALIFAQTDPELKHKGLACFLVPDRRGRLLHPGDPRQARAEGLRHRRAVAGRRRGARLRADGRDRRGLQDRDERARLGPLQRRRRLRRHLPGLARRVGRLRQGAHAVRPPDRVVPAGAGDDRRHGRPAPRRPAGWSGGPAGSRTRASRAPPRPRSPSCTRPRRRSTCADRAIQVHGGSGYVDDYPVERYLRDARVTTLYEGTSQIQKLIIGRAYTGINALVP